MSANASASLVDDAEPLISLLRGSSTRVRSIDTYVAPEAYRNSVVRCAEFPAGIYVDSCGRMQPGHRLTGTLSQPRSGADVSRNPACEVQETYDASEDGESEDSMSVNEEDEDHEESEDEDDSDDADEDDEDTEEEDDEYTEEEDDQDEDEDEEEDEEEDDEEEDDEGVIDGEEEEGGGEVHPDTPHRLHSESTGVARQTGIVTDHVATLHTLPDTSGACPRLPVVVPLKKYIEDKSSKKERYIERLKRDAERVATVVEKQRQQREQHQRVRRLVDSAESYVDYFKANRKRFGLTMTYTTDFFATPPYAIFKIRQCRSAPPVPVHMDPDTLKLHVGDERTVCEDMETVMEMLSSAQVSK